MRQNLTKNIIPIFISLLLVSCNGGGQTETITKQQGTGNLKVIANGEDFVKQGFVSKDGWQIDFERVEVNVADINAYQVEGGFNPDKDANLKDKQAFPLISKLQTVNLATDVDSVVVEKQKVPEGFYNALSWKMLPSANEGISGNHTILIEGTATKANDKIDFLVGFEQPVEYLCGEFVGDTRKGIIKPDVEGELEMTFHFDHIFGDGEAEAEAEINQKALGFEPLAKLATSDSLQLSWQDLQQQLSPEAYQMLETAVAGLGHVGEGHCSTVKLE